MLARASGRAALALSRRRCDALRSRISTHKRASRNIPRRAYSLRLLSSARHRHHRRHLFVTRACPSWPPVRAERREPSCADQQKRPQHRHSGKHVLSSQKHWQHRHCHQHHPLLAPRACALTPAAARAEMRTRGSAKRKPPCSNAAANLRHWLDFGSSIIAVAIIINTASIAAGTMRAHARASCRSSARRRLASAWKLVIIAAIAVDNARCITARRSAQLVWRPSRSDGPRRRRQILDPSLCLALVAVVVSAMRGAAVFGNRWFLRWHRVKVASSNTGQFTITWGCGALACGDFDFIGWATSRCACRLQPRHSNHIKSSSGRIEPRNRHVPVRPKVARRNREARPHRDRDRARSRVAAATPKTWRNRTETPSPKRANAGVHSAASMAARRGAK